ncbi:unnamed protein product [Peniophora sp. CBMAI 1063]|nr:unnamed protein product [Peniophora sp. CBMAI 1063]
MRPSTNSAAQWTSDLYSYADQPNSNLLCCICQYPFVEPTTTRTCAHTFCRNCILHALQTSPHCPIDRSPLNSENLGPATPIIRDMVDELVVRCSNEAKGCPARIQRQLLKTHIREDCQYASVPCPDQQCTLPVQRRRARTGQCTHARDSLELEGDDAPIASSSTTCANCSKHLPSAEALAKHIDECASCPHLSHGCSWRGHVDELNDQHINSCPYGRLEGFFTIHDSRAARLEEENQVLRIRLDATEGLVRTLLADMAALKSSLGPFFLADVPAQPALQPEPSPSGLLGSPAMQHEQANTSPRNSADIASYFPPALPSSPTYADTQPAVASPGTSPRSDSDAAPRPTRNPPQPIPLHKHVSSLISSMDALIGDQEAYRRDTDAAHAQLVNEVGALRATVGGLRMYTSELSQTVGALVAERGGLPDDGGGLGGPPVGSLPWLGRTYGSPSYGPGFSHPGPLAPPFTMSPPSSVPVKL